MRRILPALALLYASTVLLPPPAFGVNGPCFPCEFDIPNRCEGWASSDCQYRCSCASPVGPTAYLDTPQPGVLATRGFRGLIVSGVLPDSPASRAGILPGDRIVLIAGKKPSDASPACNGWSPDRSARQVALTLGRGSRTWTVVVPLVPTQRILEGLWAGSVTRRDVLPVALRTGGGGRTENLRPYITGLRWRHLKRGLTVTEVMRASPAQLAGIKPGDVILDANGRALDSQGAARDSWLSGGNAPMQCLLIIERHGVRRTVRLTSAGMSEIVRRLASGPAPVGAPQPSVASNVR